jgi:hypothetical protein
VPLSDSRENTERQNSSKKMAREYLVLCVGGLEYATMGIIDESIKDAFAKTSQLPTEYSIRCLTDPGDVQPGHAAVGKVVKSKKMSLRM